MNESESKKQCEADPFGLAVSGLPMSRYPLCSALYLRHPTTDRSQADSHVLADMLNTQSLFLDHAHNFQFETGVEFFSLLCH